MMFQPTIICILNQKRNDGAFKRRQPFPAEPRLDVFERVLRVAGDVEGHLHEMWREPSWKCFKKTLFYCKLVLMQIVRAVRVGQLSLLTLPHPEEIVCGDVHWGVFTKFGTPAYWRAQVWLDEPIGRYQPSPLGRDLAEEVAACMLAGFGMPSEVGLEAFQRIKGRGLIDNPRGDLIEEALLEPLNIRGRKHRYRFPRQKALQLLQALSRVRFLADFDDALLLRDALMTLPGVGPKTASWIVRNRLGSDAVAILDVHVIRACVEMRLFIEFSAQHYPELERRFVRFSQALGVRASILDNAMWQQLRVIPRELRSS